MLAIDKDCAHRHVRLTTAVWSSPHRARAHLSVVWLVIKTL